MNVGILIFDGIEVLDLGGPFEVFSVASRVAQRRGLEAPFTVFTVAATDEAVAGRGNFRVLPHYSLDDHPPIELLIVPGGVVDQPLQDPRVMAWVKEQSARATLVASVCTGAFILAQAGLLEGKQATTHWEDADDLERQYPGVQVLRDVAWVDEGSVVSSGGISAGIDMSLYLVGRLLGNELAVATARQMEYRWQPR